MIPGLPDNRVWIRQIGIVLDRGKEEKFEMRMHIAPQNKITGAKVDLQLAKAYKYRNEQTTEDNLPIFALGGNTELFNLALGYGEGFGSSAKVEQLGFC